MTASVAGAEWNRRGITREVFLVGRLAVKVPSVKSWQTFLWGLLANMQEREFARCNWPELCPVLFSLPGGWLIVMRRARPLTIDDWQAFDADAFSRPDGVLPVEKKRDSFGWLDGRIVAVDYGN